MYITSYMLKGEAAMSSLMRRVGNIAQSHGATNIDRIRHIGVILFQMPEVGRALYCDSPVLW